MPPSTAYRMHMRNVDDTGGTWAGYIKAAREGAGLTQIGFARALGVDRATIYRWESGRTRPDDLAMIERIAEVTGIDPEEVLAAAGLKLGATVPEQPTQEIDEELEMILRSKLPERAKLELLDMLERDREADRARRRERYEWMIRRAGGEVA